MNPRVARLRAAARFQVRNRLLDLPRVGRWYVEHRPDYVDRRIRHSTRLVMDGFPRTANSYAKWAFQYAQGDGGASLAGHAHSADLLRAAVEHGLPAVVLVREPGAAVASAVQMGEEYGVDMRTGLNAWARFHERLVPVRTDLLVVTFEQVTSDFGGVVDRVNARFDTDFKGFAGTEDDLAAVAALVESANSRRSGGVVDERSVSRPSSRRRSSEELLAEAGPSCERALQRAVRAYAEILA